MRNIVLVIYLTTLALSLYGQDDRPDIVFGLIADVQYGDCEPAIGRYYRMSLDKLSESVDYMNAQDVDFTINLGDIIDRRWNDIDRPLACLDRLERKIYHLTGNHDYKDFDDNRVLYDRLNMPAEYYCFRRNRWTFIMLNTNEVAAYSNTNGTAKERELETMLEEIKNNGRPQGASYNGGVSKLQLEWLRKVLDKAQKHGDQVLVFSHHPLYPQSGFAALNNMAILDVLNDYDCIRALISGHHHAGHFGIWNGIPAITIEGMVEGKTNSYGIVSLYKDRMTLTGQGRFTSRTIHFTNGNHHP